MTPARRGPGRPPLSDGRIPAEQAITDAAARLFMDRGYRAVTVEMVAEAAGLTKAAVYYHFKDKATLLVEAARAVFAQARQATQAILTRPEPLRARLEAVAAIVLGLPQPFTAFDAMMQEAEADLAPEQLEAIRTEQERVAAVVEDAITEGARRGDIRADNPTLVAHAFIALLRVGQARRVDGTPRFSDARATAHTLMDLLWMGVSPGPD